MSYKNERNCLCKRATSAKREERQSRYLSHQTVKLTVADTSTAVRDLRGYSVFILIANVATS